MVGVAPRRINLPHLYSHIGGNLHRGALKVMATYVVRSIRSSRRSSDLARSVSRCVAGSRCGWGEVVYLEWGCWSGGGGSAILLWLRQWEAIVLCRRHHGDVLRSTCHSDLCLAACSGSVHRLTKPRWWWCSLGSDNGGGSTFLPVCVSATLEMNGGRWLQWLQTSLGIDLYFSISYCFQDNYFILVCLLVSTYVASYNLFFH
jgi:hypothetical protein